MRNSLRYTFRFYSLSFENSIKALRLLVNGPAVSNCKRKIFKIPFLKNVENKTENTFNSKFSLKLKISATETKSISIKSLTCISSYYSMVVSVLVITSNEMRRDSNQMNFIGISLDSTLLDSVRPYESNVIFNACFCL